MTDWIKHTSHYGNGIDKTAYKFINNPSVLFSYQSSFNRQHMLSHATHALCALVLASALTWQADASNGPPNISPSDDGQPGCGIRYEFRRLWRNNQIPEQFWECKTWRHPAVRRYCPPGTRFQDSWQTCVPFTVWQWTPYFDPPTRPCETVDECQEVVINPPEPEDCECPPVTPPPDECECPPVTPPCTTEDPNDTTWTPPTIPTTEDPSSTEESNPIGICPGATDSQHDPGTMSCAAPQCTIQEWLTGTLWPTRDPIFFYQCGPGSGNLETKTCAPGTCFSFQDQVCVHPRNWRNDCA